MGAGSAGEATPRALALEGVSVRFGGIRALSDVSMTVDVGEVVGLIGPNGAGKTTAFNAITGYLPGHRGEQPDFRLPPGFRGAGTQNLTRSHGPPPPRRPRHRVRRPPPRQPSG